jgi:Na+-transporting NADH:ubiquinone oxidoreductase subunit A
MALHRVTKGLELAIQGEPEQRFEGRAASSRVALVAGDYVGLRPTMLVEAGQDVLRGQPLFEDKKIRGVHYTAPGAGRVAAINRGARRAFESLVIELSDADRAGRGEQVALSSFTGRAPAALDRDAVHHLLLESGLWTALRARPFSRVADPRTAPHSVFVTAMDTDPLAPDVEVVMRGREADFATGVAVLTRLTDGPVFVCTSDRFSLTVPSMDRVRHERFAGPHPAGTVGYHIHTLDPAGRTRTVWHIGYQDVLDVGHLFKTGEIAVDRVIALAGPAVVKPRLVRTRIGASTDEITADELVPGEIRVISGSVLSGRRAAGPTSGFLGRYHRQVSALVEGRTREFMGWAGPGFRKYSAIPVFASRLRPGQRFAFTTAVNGSPRAIVPIGLYEKVMPFDLQPTFLLKSLLTHDVERAEQLGCLELDEEDLALCTFVCPGKNDYGPYLRDALTAIEKEG